MPLICNVVYWTGFLWELLCELSAVHAGVSRDTQCQTDPLRLPPPTSLGMLLLHTDWLMVSYESCRKKCIDSLVYGFQRSNFDVLMSSMTKRKVSLFEQILKREFWLINEILRSGLELIWKLRLVLSGCISHWILDWSIEMSFIYFIVNRNERITDWEI